MTARIASIRLLALGLALAALFTVHLQSPARATPPHQLPTIGPDLVSTPTPRPVATSAPAQPAAARPISAAPDLTHGLADTRRYTVQAGDTLWTIALEMGVDLDDMACLIAPDFQWQQPLVIGDVLEAPVDLLCHKVQSGQTVHNIARSYGITAQQIVDIGWNQLPTLLAPLTPGHHLRIPPPPASATGVVLDNELAWMLRQPADKAPGLAYAVGGPKPVVESIAVPVDWPYGTGDFAWPTYGWLSQGYHTRHRALDIAAPLGTLVTAADRGLVVRAGWNAQGYGLFIVVDHNIDYVTLYGHLSEIFVREGQIVGKGDVLGKVGSTGNSTGPHLHFEIRDFGQMVDPIPLLLR